MIQETSKPIFVFHCNNCGHKFMSNSYAINTNEHRRPLPVALLCPKCKKLIQARI